MNKLPVFLKKYALYLAMTIVMLAVLAVWIWRIRPAVQTAFVTRGPSVDAVYATGPGKSLLLSLLGLLDVPTPRAIYFDGANTTELNREQQSKMRQRTWGSCFSFISCCPNSRPWGMS